jgi:hypothetical protein
MPREPLLEVLPACCLAEVPANSSPNQFVNWDGARSLPLPKLSGSERLSTRRPFLTFELMVMPGHLA